MVPEKYVKLILVLTATCCLTEFSCTGNKTDSNQAWIDSDSIETVKNTAGDSLSVTFLPHGADILFDDFFFNFAGSRRMQMQRIAEPLRKKWKYDTFFMNDDVYTLIFKNSDEKESIKDTCIDKVTVEKIFLQKDSIRQYHFDRINGNWMLTDMRSQRISENPNASFLKFYYKFANDTKFQEKSMHNPVKFIGPNPDDDFESLEGEILPETWSAFCPPQLPKTIMYNIVYGDDTRKPSDTKLFVISGIANGLEIKMTFAKEHGAWKLQKYEQ